MPYPRMSSTYGVYYFSKRIPNDIKQYYKNDRIVICLKTN